MSRSTKSLTLARIEDLTLGSFAFVPTSETLDHLVRYLSTWSGSDKFFMIIQYTLKLIVPFLHFRARLQHKAGLRQTASSGAAQRLGKLYSIIGDARMFFRIWGLLPIIQWLTAMERSSPPTRRLLTIERLQGWSMLVYYPLEHLYYLLAHSIVPSELAVASLASLLPIRTGGMKSASSARRLALDMNAISIWSCRFWALYVLLQFAHLREDRILLKAKEKALSKSKAVTAQAEKAELRARWDALWSEVVVNLGYLPLTIHWSLEKGLFTNEIWVGIFGLIAGIASWRSGWKATALPTTAADAPPPTELGSSTSSFDMDIEVPMSLDASIGS
ncbi:hypothetical protein WOLCODRAFT_137663 [Wolfiporia cocos MD-104 SS10]|uniref:Peroxisomal biogenesis factor 11 n=1 Tax=Wolfiporia cocos (strain MD-104) TaxID=742152 RepID=A0A2H3JIP8_WOLCO|nr:hypothetical protein WOLCODRAFT_137663 [Wolfiporia cocos MD-104 SS10]